MLANKVAIVTGASRGAGRACRPGHANSKQLLHCSGAHVALTAGKGVALALGEAGATVYVTGRSSSSTLAQQTQPEQHHSTAQPAPGTVEDTAQEVTRRGGRGIPVVCDHTDTSQVHALFARVTAEQQGRLDLLVNAAWGGNQLPLNEPQPPWEMLVEQHWDNMFGAGVRAALLASCQAAALMVPARSGLIINVTAWDDDKYMGHFMYDLAKASLNRLAFGMSRELQQHQVSVLALAAGWMRTELVLAAFGCSNTLQDIYGGSNTSQQPHAVSSCDNPDAEFQAPESDGTAAVAGTSAASQGAPSTAGAGASSNQLKHWMEVPELSGSTESPLFLGRAVAALAADPEGAAAASLEGRVLRVADLAVRYGFRDVDGRQPGRFVVLPPSQ